MRDISKKTKTVILSVVIFIVILAALPFILYLKVLPYIVSNQEVISYVQEYAKESMGVDLKIQKPVLETQLNPVLAFKVDEITLEKDKDVLLSIKNLDTVVSFAKVFQKSIVLKKIGLDCFYADVNKLSSLSGEQKTQPAKSDWTVEWFDSLLYLKKCLIVYDINKDTHLKLAGSDMEITSSREPKFVRFNINADIVKGKEKLKISLSDKNNVYIKDHKLFVDAARLGLNNSGVFIDMVSDEKNNFELSVYSHKFDVKNAVELLETNLVVPNGAEMLAFFKDIKGDFDFKIDMNNKGMDGFVKVNNASLKIIPLNNLPVNVQTGYVSIDSKKIVLKDFKGYYGNSKVNRIDMAGSVTDYLKSVDTNIEATGLATNELTEKYLSKVVGCPLTLTGNSGAKMILKSKYNKIDMTWMFKIATGDDILVDGASLSPVGYDRAVVADLHLDGNNLDIKSIRYFIAKELNKNTKNVKPILTVDGKMDLATLQVKKLGFNIPKPLPSEFLNVLIGQRLFRKGTIAGNMYMINDGKVPVLKGTLSMQKVRIPSQRLSIKDAKLTTNKNTVHINAFGRFKRSDYKFSGDIKNELLFPIVVKNIHLTVDNIDVERIINSMNQQNTSNVSPVVQNKEQSLVSAQVDSDEGSDDAYTFDTGLLIVENCVLEVVKGFYKDINFGNLKATLTLDKNGLLQIKSNKFDFAEGISTLKVVCDLKKHNYYIRLGVKDINSDLIATTLLALKKEITGKAMGLIELSTDDSLKLNGKIRFDVSNGTIQKVGLVEYALKFAALFRNPMAMISPSTVVDLVNVPEGNFDKINGDLHIKNNVVERIMIKSSAPQLSSFIIGRFDLESRDASLRIYTKFSNKNKGFAGFMRNISLNSLANRVPLSSRNDSMYYSAELAQIPEIDADEKDCQVFLTKVDGDVEHFNFLSSLKKIK